MRDVALTAAEAVRLVPRGTAEIHRMLTKTAAALVSGGEQVRAYARPLRLVCDSRCLSQDVFTPMYLIVMQKPLTAK